METIKLIAIDMDGTLLLDGGKGMPADNIAALREAHQAGIHLALCSGRIPDDMGFYALDAGVPMHILSLNGTCLLDAPLGSIIRSNHIADDAARGIVTLLQSHPVEYALFSNHDMLFNTPASDGLLKLFFGDNLFREGCRTHVSFDLTRIDSFLAQGINKFMVFTDHHPRALQAIQEYIAVHFPGVDVCSSWVNNLEINPRGANKGVALRALADELHIPMSQVMAIGDNDNDLPMLNVAGTAVAMGNATPAVMEAADYVTLPNHECGVAAAIRSIALGLDVPGVRRLK